MKRLWPGVVLSVAAVLLMLAMTAWTAGVPLAPENAAPAPAVAIVAPATNGTPSWIVDPPPVAEWIECNVVPRFTITLFGGPACDNGNSAAWEAWAAATELATMQNILIMMGNSFNHTAAEIANLNATAQELLSYYEERAEQIVPYFLNVSWNESTRDQIAIDSGLVPSMEGLAMAYATQMFQDWNSTVTSWNNLFGQYGTYAHSGFPAGTGINENQTNLPYHPGTGIPLMVDGVNYTASFPWEAWNGTNHSFFFNLMPGGTIVCANITSGYTASACPTFQVNDFTRGTSFTVPDVTFNNFAQDHAIPVETTLQHIGQFDLLKLTCKANCTGALTDVEVVGGYAFLNRSTADPDLTEAPPFIGPSAAGFENSMVYRLFIASEFGSSSFAAGWEPSVLYSLCGMVSTNFVGHACQTGSVNPAGNTTALGSGPAAVAAANDSTLQYAQTFQNLLNNTVNDSEVYYLTLRAITDDAKYSIPAECIIPGPSAGFPASVNPADYHLSLSDQLVVYFSWLDGVAKTFGNHTIFEMEFCGNPHLALGFNWSASWILRTQINASIFLTNLQGHAVWPNGTLDPSAVYSSPVTWPVRSVNPVLLYPYEFEADIRVGTIYNIPANNPFAGILVNYSGNVYYGANISGETWGVPTYLQLYGEGNFTYPNGTNSTISGGTPANGSAIFIHQCYVNSVAQATCNLSVTYFNSFVYGHENGLVGPPPPPGGGGGGSSGINGGICQSLFGWIPFIGTYIVGLCNLILGALEIVLIIVVLAVAIWLVSKARSGRSGGGGARGGGNTVNVYAGPGQRRGRNYS